MQEATIVESKKLIEDLQARHKGELQATEEKYRAQKKIQQAMQAQILDLSGQLAQALGPSAEPEGAAGEFGSPSLSLFSTYHHCFFLFFVFFKYFFIFLSHTLITKTLTMTKTFNKNSNIYNTDGNW